MFLISYLTFRVVAYKEHSMNRYESAIVQLKASGLYSSTVAIALRAEYRRQCLNYLARNMLKDEENESPDNTGFFQEGPY